MDSLEDKGNWASMEELQSVVPFHKGCFENILNKCEESPSSVLSSELTFATRYLAVFLFIEVKGTRPMTYQYLTVEMCEKAKSNGGFVDQTAFKTVKTYGFDSFILDKESLQLIDEYIRYVRPLLNPLCDFLLVNRNGLQFAKLTDLMSKLVYDAIGKADGTGPTTPTLVGPKILPFMVKSSHFQSSGGTNSQSDHSDLGRTKNLVIYGQRLVFKEFWSDQ